MDTGSTPTLINQPVASFTPSYCPITEYILVDQKIDGVLQTSGSTLCTPQPCQDVTVDTSLPRTINFKIKVKNMAFEVTSPEFTVNVVCLPANVVMSSSISVSSFQFVHLDTVSNRLVFGPFTCSVPECCQNI